MTALRFTVVIFVVLVSTLGETFAQYNSATDPPYLATSASCDLEGMSILHKKVTKVEEWTRPLNSSSGRRKRGIVGIKHAGVVVTTTDGKRYLIHKGNDYSVGNSWRTVVSCSSSMSNNNWTKKRGPKTVSGTKTVSDYIRAGGKDYRIIGDNCLNGVKRMYALA